MDRGFTIIELLVVFTLLALLLSIAVPRYLASTDAAREKVRVQNAATLRDALDKFRADQGYYPAELAELVQKQYLRKLPEDPVSGSSAWTPLPHPAGIEPGIYDVAPPGIAPTASGAADGAEPPAAPASQAAP
ncbi:prepilin-type N-terminal cleavage/methylation domain-containing protein [Ramlibacter sp.]|uniref:type II secretion system protein n=1 Tax=Ramlibacter sp. TaxID=1917967 RepID=UPI003416DDF2